MPPLIVGHLVAYFVFAFAAYLFGKFGKNLPTAILWWGALGIGWYFLGWWILVTFVLGSFSGLRTARYERARALQEAGLSDPLYPLPKSRDDD